jgi:hypothetical protein
MLGGVRGASFEPRSGLEQSPLAMGLLSSPSPELRIPVYSGEGLAPDLFCLPPRERHFWVSAQSIFLTKPVLRQVKTAELMAIWDYEGKSASRGWSRDHRLRILQAHLLSPPGKMLRAFVQAVCNAILFSGAEQPPDPIFEMTMKGVTSEVPFSPLEAKVTTRVSAAQTDFAKVDLTAWSSPSETEEEAHARVILRRFAVRWWADYLARDAMRWWRSNGRNPQDLAAIEDCLYRARAASYWHWHRGSRIFFWRFPKEFRSTMRNGTPFYHLADPPVGFAHNMPAPS